MDADFITSTHKKITSGAKTAKGIKDIVNGTLANLDPTGASQLAWVIDQAVGWVVGKLGGPHADALLVSFLITIEYAKRTKVSFLRPIVHQRENTDFYLECTTTQSNPYSIHIHQTSFSTSVELSRLRISAASVTWRATTCLTAEARRGLNGWRLTLLMQPPQALRSSLVCWARLLT